MISYYLLFIHRLRTCATRVTQLGARVGINDVMTSNTIPTHLIIITHINDLIDLISNQPDRAETLTMCSTHFERATTSTHPTQVKPLLR